MATPYSPLLEHDHAAADLAMPLVKALGPKVELHVFSHRPGGKGIRYPEIAHGVTFYHENTREPRGLLNRVGLYPYACRTDWARSYTAEFNRLVELLRPDVVHVEYLQPSEVIVSTRDAAQTITLHDVTARVSDQLAVPGFGPTAQYRRWESHRIHRAERRAVANADGILVMSERDAADVSASNPNVLAMRLGIDPPDFAPQNYAPTEPAVLLFSGALWREANQRSAVFLANEVMPRVAVTHPTAKLRIVGSRPTPEVLALSKLPNVEVVGFVEDLDGEIARAAVNLAPSMVEAGILLKALRALAMGSAVVLNRQSAEPIVGLVPGTHALVANSADDWHSAIVSLLDEPLLRQRLGLQGSTLVRENYSWRGTAQTYVEMFDRASLARVKAAADG